MPRFPQESAFGTRISARATHDLDGDDPVQPRIPSAAYLAHATSAKETNNLAWSQKAARCKLGKPWAGLLSVASEGRRQASRKAARDAVAVEQRLDLASNRLIAGAGVRQECRAFGGWTVEGIGEHRLDARPSVGVSAVH